MPRRRAWLGWLGTVLFVLLIGLYYLFWGVYDVTRDVTLSGAGPTAEARVVAQNRNKGPAIVSLAVRFRTADGTPTKGTVYEFRRPAPRVGSTIPVRYDPAHPGWLVRDATSGATVVQPIVFLALGLGIAAAGVAILLRPGLVGGWNG